MTKLRPKHWTLFAVIGLAYWFFGNLYESMVFSPNWVSDSPAQMQRLNEFFVNTSPAWYFLAVAPFATVSVWTLLALNTDRRVAQDYKRASLFTLLANIVNVYIVGTLITKLFGADYLQHAAQLNSYCWRWNICNVLRMALVATAAGYLFNAFRTLDRERSAHAL
jgi:hypothetical protein